MADDKDVEIDESLYSRQRLMLGETAMKRMAKSSVLISGLGGLGVEIAKNVALAGVKTLTLNDTQNTTWLDLSANFYLRPQDVGKSRVQSCSKQISQLNPYVKFVVTEHDLGKVELSYFDQFTCVILTEAPLSVQLRVNEYCHSKNIRFIAADARGLFTWAFVDFGVDFEIFDTNGEENKEVLVGKITKANPGVVTTLNDEKHGFEDGNFVTFREVKGMEALNGSLHPIKVLSPTSFSIGDTSSLPDYLREGIVSQTKQPVKMTFAPLKDSLLEPALAIVDFAKFDKPAHMHVGMRALHAFHEKNGRLPAPWSATEAQEVVSLAKEINGNKVDGLDEELIKRMAFTAQGSISPLASFMGGMVAQECLKALSGKYTPLNQWIYLDGIEVMPPLDTDPAQFRPAGNRLDGQVICVGKDLCAKVANLKLFMVGCGAIGCEMMKNYAMLGVATGENGLITVTDNDLIEKSNLNRQFLFRPKDLQKPKSESGARAAKEMNPDIKIQPFLDKVGPDTEAKYSDQFFSGLDIVVNALDNVNARLYMDSRCVTNKKPLLESGTLGPKGHVQVIIPFKTESYGSQRDPPEKDVPFCTLKSFPNQIEHCIEWARDFSFGGLFVSKPMQWNQLVDEPNLVERLGQPNGGGVDLKIVRTAVKLLRNRPKSFDDCLAFARRKFEDYYINKTIQLLHNFPLDHKVDDKGTLFWTSPKRPPTHIKFDWNDPIHKTFVVSLANLYAEIWSLPRHKEEEKIKQVVESVKLPVFRPKEGKKIETDESIKKGNAPEQQAPKEEEIEDLLKELQHYFASLKGPSFKLKAIDFEKDDDTNFHIDFISSTANLRARMYAIPEVDRLRVKAIAGRIMPAIATTTSCVSGCVSLELLKLVKGLELDKFKNLFMNLALPYWAFSEPGAAERKKITGSFSYTLWDSWDVKEGDITLGEFIDYFQKKYNLVVAGVFKGAIMVFVPMFPGHLKRKPQKMSALLKRKPGDKYEDLIVTFTDEKDQDVSGPPIRFFYDK